MHSATNDEHSWYTQQVSCLNQAPTPRSYPTWVVIFSSISSRSTPSDFRSFLRYMFSKYPVSLVCSSHIQAPVSTEPLNIRWPTAALSDAAPCIDVPIESITHASRGWLCLYVRHRPCPLPSIAAVSPRINVISARSAE